jgi:16S rRNA (guanine966-N2)-methyltransferase
MSLRIYGNRLLKTLPGRETRPSVARVREALFNSWQGQIEGCRWLDLCAGSGAIGAEALCRGASRVVGIEQSPPACAVIQHNWQAIAADTQTIEILRGDVLKKLPTLIGQQFDRIYFDPPYASNLYTPVLVAIAHYHLLNGDGEIAVEHDPHLSLVIPELLEQCRHKVYGNTALTFLRHKPALVDKAEETRQEADGEANSCL